MGVRGRNHDSLGRNAGRLIHERFDLIGKLATGGTGMGEVMIGVDAHKRSHTLVAVDEVGRKLGERVVADLRAAGETNAVRARSRTVASAALFPAALAAMRGEDGRVPVTLRLAMMTGWVAGEDPPTETIKGN